MIQVELVHINENYSNGELVKSMEIFEDAQKYNDKNVQKWVKAKAAEYSKKPGFEDVEDNYYEFRYKKLSKIEVPAGEWVVCQVEFLTDKL